MKCKLISIGDELLIGQVINTNAAFLGQELTGIGVEVSSVVVIGDNHEEIRDHVAEALNTYDIVITTGGLGPTKDDITKKAIAEVLNVPLIYSEEAFDHLAEIIRGFGREPTEAHVEQCHLPETAEIFHNMKGTAPGMHFIKKEKHLFVLPGVPHEMKYLMSHGVIPSLQSIFPNLAQRLYRTFSTAGKGESRLAESIADIEDSLPPFLKLAYLPKMGIVRIRLMGSIRNQDEMNTFERTSAILTDRLGDLLFTTEDITLAESIGQILLTSNSTMSVAESCTGGYTGHLLTSNAGSSAYFESGAITYSNALKQSILGVQEATLDEFGAVSQETVEEMVAGALHAFQSDYAVAITGIAGPGGGTDTKPVGTVWIAVANKKNIVSKKWQFVKDRGLNIELSANMALNMMRLFLKQKA